MTTGEILKSLRKDRGITQRHLAELTGLATITIQGYEAGKYKPKYEQLQRIATALEIPVTDLIDENMEAQSIKSTWDRIQNNDEKRKALLTEILKTHNYQVEEKDIHWLIVTDHQGYSFLVGRDEYEEMCLRCDKDIRYNVEKLLNNSREYKKDK